MKIEHIFLAFMVVCGLVVGGVRVAVPQSSQFVIPPYFWILIAMFAFEGLAHWRFGGNLGSLISMGIRFTGFFVAVGLMFAIIYFAGGQVSLL